MSNSFEPRNFFLTTEVTDENQHRVFVMERVYERDYTYQIIRILFEAATFEVALNAAKREFEECFPGQKFPGSSK